MNRVNGGDGGWSGESDHLRQEVSRLRARQIAILDAVEVLREAVETLGKSHRALHVRFWSTGHLLLGAILEMHGEHELSKIHNAKAAKAIRDNPEVFEDPEEDIFQI